MREEREEHLAWVQFENEGLVTFPGPGVVEWKLLDGQLGGGREGKGGGGEGEQQVTRDDGLVGTIDDRREREGGEPTEQRRPRPEATAPQQGSTDHE